MLEKAEKLVQAFIDFYGPMKGATWMNDQETKEMKEKSVGFGLTLQDIYDAKEEIQQAQKTQSMTEDYSPRNAYDDWINPDRN